MIGKLERYMRMPAFKEAFEAQVDFLVAAGRDLLREQVPGIPPSVEHHPRLAALVWLIGGTIMRIADTEDRQEAAGLTLDVLRRETGRALKIAEEVDRETAKPLH